MLLLILADEVASVVSLLLPVGPVTWYQTTACADIVPPRIPVHLALLMYHGSYQLKCQSHGTSLLVGIGHGNVRSWE